MLNWRRDPDHERKLALIETSIAFYEQRIQDSERGTKQIESETEQLREQNARGRELLASMHALCLEGNSSSTPAPPMPSVTAPFSP
jgi:hypothetical protein